MVMEHLTFFLINIVVLALLLILDRKDMKNYIWLMVFGLVVAYIFETATTYFGLWQYYSIPQIPLISLYTWLLYAPYLAFCYFVGKKLGDVHD